MAAHVSRQRSGHGDHVQPGSIAHWYRVHESARQSDLKLSRQVWPEQEPHALPRRRPGALEQSQVPQGALAGSSAQLTLRGSVGWPVRT